MDALNLLWFHWIADGSTQHGLLFWLAVRIALGASWLSVALMAWAAWRQPAERVYFVAVCLLAAASGMLAHALAAAWNLPRPFMVGLSPDWLGHGSRAAMPSTHATVMFTVALCFLWRRRLRPTGVALAGLALLTGWARIYLGVHFPFDVLSGLLLAAMLAAGLAGASLLVRQLLAARPARLPQARRTLSRPGSQ